MLYLPFNLMFWHFLVSKGFFAHRAYSQKYGKKHILPLRERERERAPTQSFKEISWFFFHLLPFIAKGAEAPETKPKCHNKSRRRVPRSYASIHVSIPMHTHPVGENRRHPNSHWWWRGVHAYRLGKKRVACHGIHVDDQEFASPSTSLLLQ